MTKRTIAGGGTAELEVGKVYLNRLGLACRIVRSFNNDTQFWDDAGRMYDYDGYWKASGNHDNDLIEEA